MNDREHAYFVYVDYLDEVHLVRVRVAKKSAKQVTLAGRHPYRGLSVFRSDDVDFSAEAAIARFVRNRAADIDELKEKIERLERHSALASRLTECEDILEKK